VVEKNFAKDQRIIVGCQAGPRSTRAANMLLEAGYQDVSNLLGGLRRYARSDGKISLRRLAASGLPDQYDNGDGVSYESLSAKGR
jgi:3-mercaptopyruvate sulfurtransferase SseA